MPKKLNLDLNGLKVQSFVTSLDKRDESKIKGGSVVNTVCPPTICPECEPTGTCYTNCGTCVTCTCETCNTNCGTCETCASCPTCYPKVYTCDPQCTDGC